MENRMRSLASRTKSLLELLSAVSVGVFSSAAPECDQIVSQF